MALRIEDYASASPWIGVKRTGCLPSEGLTSSGCTPPCSSTAETGEWEEAVVRAPVRVANGAYDQFQLDIFGEVLDCLYLGRHFGLVDEAGDWRIEEYDPLARRQLGHFPQAFSHLGLINTARNLTHREKPAAVRAEA